MVDVFVNGVKFVNGTDFTATNGTTVVMATGLATGNIVEIDNLLTAYLPTNALRTITTFTATAAQTTFSVSYTQGLIDVFYNGSCLAQTEYTATNGTSIILATACQVNDIVAVYAYTYSVGAYSGIGGSGTTNYVSKFSSSSAITDSSIYNGATGFVSIGNTNSSSYNLDVTGTGRFTSTLLVSGAATFSSSVGVGGLTPYANTLSAGGIDIVGGAGLYANGNDFFVVGNAYFNSGWFYKATSFATKINGDGSGNIIFYNAPSGTAAAAVTFAERMRITSAGDLVVGGTSAPQTAAGRGDITINGTSSAILTFTTNGTERGYVYANGTDMFYNNSTAGGRLYCQNISGGVYLNQGATSWTANTSDERKKKNFETTQGLAEVLQIEPVKYHFEWDDDSIPKRMGFKAQNILPLIPEMVMPNGEKWTDGSNILTITADYLLPVLVKAIQELSKELSTLKAIVATK
jgi:hypothetical protein